MFLLLGFLLPGTQVTEQAVRLISPVSKQLVQEWRPPGHQPISACACNPSQLLIASGPELYYFGIAANGILTLARFRLEEEAKKKPRRRRRSQEEEEEKKRDLIMNEKV